MINSYTSVDQRNKERQGLDIEKYSLGWFDGLIGCQPTQLEDGSYWQGYQLGQREYWAKKLGIKISIEI